MATPNSMTQSAANAIRRFVGLRNAPMERNMISANAKKCWNLSKPIEKIVLVESPPDSGLIDATVTMQTQIASIHLQNVVLFSKLNFFPDPPRTASRFHHSRSKPNFARPDSFRELQRDCGFECIYAVQNSKTNSYGRKRK